MTNMRWWQKLSRMLEDDPVDASICSRCMFWTPVSDSETFQRCRNLTSKHYDETTAGDFGCEEFVKFGSKMDDTPVEIPAWLHRKRTEGTPDDEDS